MVSIHQIQLSLTSVKSRYTMGLTVQFILWHWFRRRVIIWNNFNLTYWHLCVTRSRWDKWNDLQTRTHSQPQRNIFAIKRGCNESFLGSKMAINVHFLGTDLPWTWLTSQYTGVLCGTLPSTPIRLSWAEPQDQQGQLQERAQLSHSRRKLLFTNEHSRGHRISWNGKVDISCTRNCILTTSYAYKLCVNATITIPTWKYRHTDWFFDFDSTTFGAASGGTFTNVTLFHFQCGSKQQTYTPGAHFIDIV